MWKSRASRIYIGRMVRNVSLGTLTFFDFLFLKINRESKVRDAVICDRRPACQVCDVLYVSRPHDPLVEDRNIHKKFIERNILLSIASDKVVKLQPGDREYRLSIQLRVIQTIQ